MTLENSVELMILVFFQNLGKWRRLPVTGSPHEQRQRIQRRYCQRDQRWFELSAMARRREYDSSSIAAIAAVNSCESSAPDGRVQVRIPPQWPRKHTNEQAWSLRAIYRPLQPFRFKSSRYDYIRVDYKAKWNHRFLDLRAALTIWSICLAPNLFVPFCLDSCPIIRRTSGSGTARRT